MTVFDEAIQLAPLSENRWTGHTHPGYANMVGPFGGITAAQVLQAVLRHPACLGQPVALTVNYAAAVADGPFEIEARPVRTNRSTQHWMVTLEQSDEVLLTATVLTAVRRSTWAAPEHPMPAVPPPEQLAVAARPITVAWVERYEMRFVQGELPLTWDGTEFRDSVTRLWVRDRPERPLDAPALAAMADVFFPRVWRRRAQQVPAGTVSMTVYFHADDALLAQTGTGYLLAQAQAQCFRGGFFDQTGQLWNEQGDLLATTHQIVYFKE